IPESDERGTLVHLVLARSVRLFYRRRGREITVGSVGPGGLIGLVSSFGRPADGRLAEASEPSVIASCPGGRFLEMVGGEPRVGRTVVALLCDRIVQVEQHLNQL